MNIRTRIRELPEGSVAVIVGYDQVYGGYIGRLIKMGLKPETEFIVLCTTCPEGGVEILLKERIIKLSKSEADALCVEEIVDEED